MMQLFENEMNLENKKRILFLTFRLSYPLLGGDKLKTYNILKYLAKKYDVTVVTFYQGKVPPDKYIEHLESLGLRMIVIPLKPIKAALKTLFYSNQLFPLEIRYYLQPEFQKIVDNLLKNEHFDLTFAFFMRTAEYIKNKNIKKILISEDCRVLYMNRSYKGSTNIIQKFVRMYEYFRLKKYEPNIVNHFDLVTLVTQNDIDAMKSRNSNVKYRLLTNGTDIEKYTFAPIEGRKDIVFTGDMQLWANVMMVQSIAEDIFPKIKEKIPDIKFYVVGSKPGQEILKYQSDSIIVTGRVPDFVPYLQSAAVFIHPHYSGTGIQNKLLEAMACGCPVITTDIGNQGINAKDGEEILIAKDYKEFPELSIKVLQDKELASKLGINARKLIEETHSWETIHHQLDEIIKEVLE